MILLIASASSGRFADTSPITTVHLILIAVLIVAVIGGIIWGARQKRARVEGERIEAEREEAMLAHSQTETAVSPAPPPLGDAGVTAMAPVVEPAAKPAPKARAASRPTPAKATPPAARKPAAKAAPSPKPAATEPAEKPAAPAGAAAKPPAAPKPAAKPKAADAAPSPYGLIDVKGLGPKAVPLLNGLGISTLVDLAALTPARAAEVDGQLGVLSGRLTRDRWVEQAKLLAAGDVAGFEATYGKL